MLRGGISGKVVRRKRKDVMIIDVETEKNTTCPFWALIQRNILNNNYPKKASGRKLAFFSLFLEVVDLITSLKYKHPGDKQKDIA